MAHAFDDYGGETALLDPPADALTDSLSDVDLVMLLADPAGADPVDDVFDTVPFAGVAEYEFAGVAASLDAFTELCFVLDAAEQAQFAVNRAMAAHLAATRQALDLAARNPSLYLRDAELGSRDAVELSVRAAATELSMRLHVPVGTIRTRASEATILCERLPEVWARVTDGAVAYNDARVAVEAAAGFAPGDARLPELDAALAGVIGSVTTARFRQRARTISARLERDHVQAAHARAVTERRVSIVHVDDGMSWVNLYTTQIEAAKIGARLDATARRDAGVPGETRSMDQLRADTAAAWLTGAGTPTAARTEIIVTIPLLNLTRTPGNSGTGSGAGMSAGASTSAGAGAGAGESASSGATGLGGDLAMLDGVGPIDDATARQLFADAPSFRRLAVDPVTAAPLVLDRTRYRPTRAQRLWLALTHGRCSRPGCNRLAITADLDHDHAWAHNGPTNPDNLCPLCRGDHTLKHATRYTQTKNPDHSVTWASPTGRTYTDPPPF